MNDHIIFCDLDGVLVDLLGQMSNDLKKNIKELPDRLIYKTIHEYFEGRNKKFNIEYWSDLPKQKDCDELWDFLKPYSPLILTATMANRDIAEGKIKWCKKNLKLDKHRVFPVNHSRDKQEYASPRSILIDDLPKNIKQFREKGGIGVLHKDAASTIKKLKKILG